jgi:ABC-2 type transport system ATP-binding protein
VETTQATTPAPEISHTKATGGASAIRVRGLEKHFGRIRAVDGMDFDVPEASVFGFIGPNGAGKTTFIKLVLGIAAPTSGDITVLSGSPSDVHVRRRIGYLPERLTLPAAFTPVAFLRSVGRMKGLSKKVIEDQVPRVLTEVALDESAWSRTTGKFSKGMKQRTGLAAALIGDPALLVLDEPTDGIDPIGRSRIRDVIRAANARGTTVFLNSHLLAETEKLCDHVAIVLNGRVVKSGGLGAMRAEGRFRVRFEAGETTDARATPHGFVVDEDARHQGMSGAFTFEGNSVQDLSRALALALADGLIVMEVAPKMKDLEAVLAETVLEEGSPMAKRGLA